MSDSTVSDTSCIVSAALSGVAADRRQCPAIPYTPDEYAREARRAFDAGATIVHLHARREDGSPSYRVEDYRAITDAIRAEVPELVINYSTGAIGIPLEERVAPITELVPDIGALNMGSMNFAKYSSSRKEFVFDFCFENRFETIMFFLDHMNDVGVKPECECFDTGHVHSLLPLIDKGDLRAPVNVSLVMGVLGGAPPRVDTLAHMSSLVPDGATWQLVGIGRQQWLLLDEAVRLGGNVRVGLEDNFYMPDGAMAGSNGDLVAEAVGRITDGGRAPATPAETRARLGLAPIGTMAP